MALALSLHARLVSGPILKLREGPYAQGGHVDHEALVEFLCGRHPKRVRAAKERCTNAPPCSSRGGKELVRT